MKIQVTQEHLEKAIVAAQEYRKVIDNPDSGFEELDALNWGAICLLGQAAKDVWPDKKVRVNVISIDVWPYTRDIRFSMDEKGIQLVDLFDSNAYDTILAMLPATVEVLLG